MTLLLETRSVSKPYGAFRALDDVPRRARRRVRLGRRTQRRRQDHAGQSADRAARADPGRGPLQGQNIAGVGPVALAERGMARAFQLVQIFPAADRGRDHRGGGRSRGRKALAPVLAAFRPTSEISARVARGRRHLRPRATGSTRSRLLSQGEKKLLDVASAFALDPEVILLDEPTSGVSTADKHGIMKTLIAAAKRAGVKAIILVEHDMDLVAAYSHRIIALSEGKVLADLPPDASSPTRI